MKSRVTITWINVYSDTMDDDELGRWAIRGYVGKGMRSHPIAWIKKIPNHSQLTVSAQFPYSGNYTFYTVDEAKIEVERVFNEFINDTLQN